MMMVRVMMFVALLAVAAGMSACNTVNGIGEDISGGAKTVHGWIN